MKMHEHVICKQKKISWGQPNPNLTAHNHCNKVNTHLKCMKHCYNANEMQCMMIYNHLHKTHPKNFTKTSSILKKPKKISKTQNLDLNAWNAWRMSKREIIPSDLRQVKGRKSRGLKVLREKWVFGRWKYWVCWERSGRSEEKIAQNLYIEKS